MTITFILTFLLQIGIFTPYFPENKIYLKPEYIDTSKMAFRLFQDEAQQAPYISLKESFLTLRIKNIINGNYSEEKKTNKPLNSFLNFDLIKYDRFGLLKFIDFSNAKNEIQFQNINLAYNMVSGKADFGINLINKKDFDFKLGLNLSFDYLRLKRLQDLKLFGNQLVYNTENLSGDNQFFVSYRFENLEILSKYEIPIFNQHEHKFNEDKISIVMSYGF